MRRRLAEQLRMHLQPERSVTEQIHHFLRDRSLLLVLDNLEQLEGAPQVVRELLQVGPGVKILVTSRRALDLRGEVLLELAPMPTEEAVALFIERAQALRPDFVLTPETRPEVEALCRRLEGVPLAIELAAARSIGMTPRQIRQRLNERFRLLQSKSPDLAPRQRALRSAIDWSYCLLGDEEKRIFAQLSVFVGGFTLEDAEGVCDGWDVLESVLELRKHSFFRMETDAQTQQTRFLMLESLREYAAEQLAEADEEARAVCERHAEYFLRFAREQNGKYRTGEEMEAVRQLEQQSGNLNAALEWAAGAGRPTLYAELARLIGHRLVRRGFLREAISVVQQGLETILPLQAEHPVLAEELLRERAGLFLDVGDLAEARRLAQEALTLSTQLGNTRAQARAEDLLGQIAQEEKDYAAARAHFARELAYAEQVGATAILGNAYNNLSIVERRDISEDAEENVLRRNTGAQYLEKALRLRQASNDRRGMAEVYNNLGVQSYDNGRYDQAWDYYAEALTLNHQLQNSKQCGIALFNLGEVALKLDAPDLTVPLLIAAERLLEEAQFPHLAVVTELADEVAAGRPEIAVAQLRSHAGSLPVEVVIANAVQTVASRRSPASGAPSHF
jgi:predicted ATPase